MRKAGKYLVYRSAKQHSEPASDRRGLGADELTFTLLALIDRIAARRPPPRTHRHRYSGVLAPSSPLRSAVTAMAMPTQQAQQPPSHALSACQLTVLPDVLLAQAGADIRQILDHIGVDSEPPCVTPARGPPLWDGCDADAQRGEEGQAEPDWAEAAQPAPDYEVDQRISW